MKSTAGQLVRIEKLTSSQRAQMFALMKAFYVNVKRPRFERDLDEKQWAILLNDAQRNTVVGFSTQVTERRHVDGRDVIVLFSGDTIVHRDYWGRNSLAGIWGKLAIALIDQHIDTEVFWFLICKGYKTFRFLPTFFHDFYPSFEWPTPTTAARVLDMAATSRFAAAYDRQAGIIRARTDSDRLRAGIADITGQRLRDPYVRFFVQRNPGHVRGDELCCLAPLTRANFTAAACRVIRAASDVSPLEATPTAEATEAATQP